MKVKKHKARCKRVMVILANQIQTLPLLREETYPPVGDFADGPITYAVCKHDTIVSIEVMFPIDSVIFLKD